jgi:SAM-dependent methyltransferase
MIYDFPQYYEVAFSFREFAREAQFLHTSIQRFSDVTVKWVLEIACGTAPHAGELTRLGYRYMGLDINPAMLEYASFKWRDISPRPELLKADMVSFDTPCQVEFAFVMLGSLYLNSAAQLTSHFDAVSRCLRKGGLYFLDWCVQFVDPMAADGSTVTAHSDDGIDVESTFGITLLDRAQHLYEEVWTMNVNDNGKRHQFRMVECNRALLPQEFLEFVDGRHDFELVGWWRDWDFDKPITDTLEIDRPVVLLRRI